MMINKNGGLSGFLRHRIQHYDDRSYWQKRQALEQGRCGRVKALFYLFSIKRSDAFNNASLGTDIGWCARFASPPRLPHGIRGIFVHNNALIGKNCTIYQQVTIGERGQREDPREEEAPVIGDNVLIGAGAKLLGGIHVGNNVKIGANCVVTRDVPDGATVVCPRAVIVEAGRGGENEQ